MAKRPRDMKRGNDLLYKPRGKADEFDYYKGPFGKDMASRIQDAKKQLGPKDTRDD